MSFILLVVALVLFLLAAIKRVQDGFPQVNLGWIGLACYIASLLVAGR